MSIYFVQLDYVSDLTKKPFAILTKGVIFFV
jgi:hypothetical protein